MLKEADKVVPFDAGSVREVPTGRPAAGADDSAEDANAMPAGVDGQASLLKYKLCVEKSPVTGQGKPHGAGSFHYWWTSSVQRWSDPDHSPSRYGTHETMRKAMYVVLFQRLASEFGVRGV